MYTDIGVYPSPFLKFKSMKESKYYREAYNNPIQWAEGIVKFPDPPMAWQKEVLKGVEDAMADKQKGVYKFKTN